MDKFSELKAAAMAATPGRIGDRIDGSGSIKYECTGYDGSLVLRTDHKDMEYGFVGDNADADEMFFRLCVPDVVLELLAELEAKDKRIAELEAIRADASQVFNEIGNELGCNPDNESIMMAIDDLKATQMTGTLAMIIKRTEEMERILEGVTPEMIAGGWTAKGISDYAKSLEAKLATPVRLPDIRQSSSGDRYQWSDGAHNYRLDVISMLLGAGFTVAVEGVE